VVRAEVWRALSSSAKLLASLSEEKEWVWDPVERISWTRTLHLSAQILPSQRYQSFWHELKQVA
jgi:hypothetical protein